MGGRRRRRSPSHLPAGGRPRARASAHRRRGKEAGSGRRRGKGAGPTCAADRPTGRRRRQTGAPARRPRRPHVQVEDVRPASVCGHDADVGARRRPGGVLCVALRRCRRVAARSREAERAPPRRRRAAELARVDVHAARQRLAAPRPGDARRAIAQKSLFEHDPAVGPAARDGSRRLGDGAGPVVQVEDDLAARRRRSAAPADQPAVRRSPSAPYRRRRMPVDHDAPAHLRRAGGSGVGGAVRVRSTASIRAPAGARAVARERRAGRRPVGTRRAASAGYEQVCLPSVRQDLVAIRPAVAEL